MSLSLLARTYQTGPQAAVDARANEVVPQDVPATDAPAPVGSDRFDALVKYIPTETITLFVAAMAALPALQQLAPKANGWILYGVAAVLTPLILLLIGYGRHRQSRAAGSFKPVPWPLAASLIAFLVWGLSVPGLLEDPNAKVLAGFGAVFISTLLSLLETVFAPPPQP